MKEDMLEVLMYLFDNYVIDGLSRVEPSQDELAQELAGAGFQSEEIDKAFAWLEDLMQLGQQAPTRKPQAHTTALRVYTKDEIERLTPEGVSLLWRLMCIGVLDQFTHEMVIDRVMALEADTVDCDHLRWVVLLVLSNQPGFDEIAEWAETILDEGAVPVMH